MNRLVLTLICLAFWNGTAVAQSEIHEVAGVRCGLWKNGEVVPLPGGPPDHGICIWDNYSISSWWSGVDTGYINLDWGKLPVPSSGLSDHVIDGFTFAYGTNNRDPAGDAFAVYYYDSCTGWGNLGVHEAAFFFQGLPNGYGFPTLPPGYGWIWSVTYDIEGTGYEFFLGRELGNGMIRLQTATMGSNGLAMGTRIPNTGTENAFEVYYPSGKYNGTWWGHNWWATWPAELFGSEGEADMTLYGVGAQGNGTGLYAAGNYSGSGSLLFLLRENETGLDGYLAASFQESNQYLQNLDITRLVGNFAAGYPRSMQRTLGDFYVLRGTVPPQFSTCTVYFQGMLADLQMQPPLIDASNGLRAN